jgi:uncharacterized membrane protein YhaH (DUF805 family)
MDKTPTEWATEPLRRFAQFGGRAPRAEYWWFVLMTTVIGLTAALVDRLLGLGPLGVETLVSLGFAVPQLAVGIRRLHDIGRSGWWLGAPLLAIVSIIVVSLGMMGVESTKGGIDGALLFGGLVITGWSILLLVWACQRGTAGPNRFGADPLARD